MTTSYKLILSVLVFCSFQTKNYAQENENSLSSFIEKKREFNKNSKNGFSVLLYNGNEENAIEVFNEFKSNYENIEVKLTYVSPDWKVMTQTFTTKLSAEKTLIFIREKYPNAKIL